MRLSFFFRLMLFVSIVSLAEAAIIRVPQDYPKIQIAINSAQPGDTVLVSEGTYYENLTIRKRILLASQFIIDRNESHIANTIINGSQRTHTDSGSVVTFSGDLDTLSGICGFTITQGWGNIRFYPSDNAYGISGGGIDLINVTGLRVSHNIIHHNSTNPRNGVTNNWGGGFSTTGTLLENNIPHYIIFEYNKVYSNFSTMGNTEAGGVEFWSTGRITGNTIVYNESRNIGGGIAIGDRAIVNVSDNYIAFNTVALNTGAGGGLTTMIYNGRSPSITLENNIFYRNSATNGSQIRFSAGNYKLINNTLVHGVGTTSIYTPSGVIHWKYMINNIIWNPAATVEISDLTNHTFAANCLIRGGFTAGTNIINADPLFANPDTLFRLTPQSPAIGKGLLTYTFDVTRLDAPSADYLGMPRCCPSYTKPDLGAIENPLGASCSSAIIRVPQDYAKIQDAVNAAQAGCVVLVSEGLYNENVVISKKITLASLYYTDGDTSHISRTIISGGVPWYPDTASVIVVKPPCDTGTVITGFTLMNGTGTRYFEIRNSRYWRAGGGIMVSAQGVSIIANRIINNKTIGTSIYPRTIGGGICIWPDNPSNNYWILADNEIRNNETAGYLRASSGGGASITGSGLLMHNRFIDNKVTQTADYSSGGGGVEIWTGSVNTANVLLDGNLFSGNHATPNGSAVHIAHNSSVTYNYPTATLQNNIIVKNSSYESTSSRPYYGTVFLHMTTSHLINNTIADNDGNYGVGVSNSPSRVRLMNNILWNTAVGNNQIRFINGSVSSEANANFNCVYGGFSGFGNMTDTPKFAAGDPYYRLEYNSPLLGAGMMQYTVGGAILKAPERDFLGNVRQWPLGYANPDMGANENILTDAQKDQSLPTEFSLMQNYPNPFNPSTNIRYTIPQTGGDGMMIRVILKIYDILGREVATLVDAEQEPGIYTVKFEAGKLSGGVYICRLTAGSKIMLTKKMLMAK
ncbi:MAG: T9SS type A sorting domain-containing protein [Ignavibacteriales bacterium]|nr:MAG: T9SS type A sorting domain-containing protein [Ignavibacteriales bacterium]